MSDLDEMLARARSPGSFVERRRFSLNRQRAIEKLRAFSLRRPGQAVLELVQAAVHAGATYIAIDTSPSQLVVAWVGAPAIQAVELEHLFDFLFTERGNRKRRHLVQLAIATNALLKSGAQSLRIVSGDGTRGGTVRLDVAPDGSGRLGESDVDLSGTFVVLDRKRPWWSTVLWAPSSGLTEEQVLVEEQCRHTPVPILLNGSAPFGYRARRRIQFAQKAHEVSFDEGDGGRRGVLYLTENASRIDIVVGGVRICSLSMPELGVVQGDHLAEPRAWGFSGVICDDDLRKTADQGDIVRDERFGAMLQAVRPYLLRSAHRVDPRWVPPASLAAMASPEPAVGIGEGGLLAEYAQLPPRLPMPLDALQQLGDATPLFRVDLGAAIAAGMVRAADPVRLPWPVLRTSEAQAAALEGYLGRTITSLPDVSAVAMAARVHAAQAVVRVVHGSQVDSDGRRWRAYVHVDAVPLGLADEAAMWVVVRQPSGTCQLQQIEGVAGIPGFFAEVEVGAAVDSLSPEAVRAGALSVAVRLALEDPSVPTVTRARLLARIVRVVSRSTAPLRLELPPGWGVEVPGPSLERLTAAAHAGQPVEMEAAEVQDLWPLEEVVGVGSLYARGEEGLLGAVVRQGDAWTFFDGVLRIEDFLELLGECERPALVAMTSPLRHLPHEWCHPLPTLDPLVQWVGPGHPPATLDAVEALFKAVAVVSDSDSPRRAAARRRADLSLARWLGVSPALVREHAVRVLAGGMLSADAAYGSKVSWALARAGGWLDALVPPEWASAVPDPARFLFHRSFGDAAWLALPRAEDAGDPVQPVVVVDDGVDRHLVSAPLGFPVCGWLPMDAPIERYARSVWLRALSTRVVPSSHPWARQAAMMHPADSLFLNDLLPAEARGQTAARSPFHTLDHVADQDLSPADFLAKQRSVLRRMLGERIRTPASPKDDHLGSSDPVVAPRPDRLFDSG